MSTTSLKANQSHDHYQATRERLMKMYALASAATLFFAVSLPCQSQAKVDYLKEEPAKNTLPYRKVVYVDDGTCPKGEVKEITGGSQGKSIPRTVRCIKRPD